MQSLIDESPLKTTTKFKVSTSSGATDEPRRLIEAVMKKPGVAELFKFYDPWQKFEKVFELHNQLTATKQIVSTSSSSVAVQCEPA